MLNKTIALSSRMMKGKTKKKSSECINQIIEKETEKETIKAKN